MVHFPARHVWLPEGNQKRNDVTYDFLSPVALIMLGYQRLSMSFFRSRSCCNWLPGRLATWLQGSPHFWWGKWWLKHVRPKPDVDPPTWHISLIWVKDKKSGASSGKYVIGVVTSTEFRRGPTSGLQWTCPNQWIHGVSSLISGEDGGI